MIFPEDEEFLAHYGKKGMKWGVRNVPKNTSKSGYSRKTSFSSTTKAKASQLADKAKKNKKQIAKVAGTTVTLAAVAGVSAYAINRRSKTSSAYVNRFEEVKKTVDMGQKVKDVTKKPEVTEARKAIEEIYKRNPQYRPKPGQKPSTTPEEARKALHDLVRKREVEGPIIAAELADLKRRYPG